MAVEVAAPASQVRLAVARATGKSPTFVDRVLTWVAGPVEVEVDTLSHTRTRLRLDATRGGRAAHRAVAMMVRRASRRAVHYTRFGIRTGASTVAVGIARRRP